MIEVPVCPFSSSSICLDTDHIYCIENYFQQIVEVISKADSTLPRKIFKSMKPFWSQNLSDLKRVSIETCKVWKAGGRPMAGPLFNDYKSARFSYCSCLKEGKRLSMKQMNESLHDALAQKDSMNF